MAGQVYQVMEALSYGDAVSHIALDCDGILQANGFPGGILSIHIHEKNIGKCRRVEDVPPDRDDIVIFHFWGYTRLEKWIADFRGCKVLYYHNITPPHFFEPGSLAYKTTKEGYDQLLRLAGKFALAVGDSEFNVRELFQLPEHPPAGLCIPPPVDSERNHTLDEALLARLKDDGFARFLFLGRLAPNKRQDEIIRVFDYYHTRINSQSRLDLVGNDADNPHYVQSLRWQIQASASRDAIGLHGKVRDEEVVSYLRAADVFLCLSEHEGFCVPLIQAMAEGALVVAYEAAAVPETLGGAGVLVNTKDPASIAELVNVLLQDDGLKQSILSKQYERARSCTLDTAKMRLLSVIQALKNGAIPGPEEYWLTPKSPYGMNAEVGA